MKGHILTSYSLFANGCDRAMNLRAIYDYMRKSAPIALNCDDILRSALVLSVSSFDLFLHDVFRTEIMHRLISKKSVYMLRVPFDTLHQEQNFKAITIEECIRKDNAHKSFVAPAKLSECLRPLVDAPWESIAVKFGDTAEVCKSRLKSVVDLRNRIAHEADVNPEYGGLELWPIYSEDVQDAILFLRKLGYAVAEAVDGS